MLSLISLVKGYRLLQLEYLTRVLVLLRPFSYMYTHSETETIQISRSSHVIAVCCQFSKVTLTDSQCIFWFFSVKLGKSLCMDSLLMKRIFRSTPNGILTARIDNILLAMSSLEIAKYHTCQSFFYQDR